MLLILIAIIAIVAFFYWSDWISQFLQRGITVKLGGYVGSTVDEIMDYIEPYLIETDGKKNLHDYLASHFSYKEPPEDLKDFVRKIVRDKEVKYLTDFLEIAQLTYGSFIDESERCELYAKEIKYDVEPEDYAHLVKEGRSLLSEMNMKTKFDDGELRRIFRRNMDRWKKLKFKRPAEADKKYELDKMVFRVYLRNYVKCSCLDEKKQIEELRRLVRDYPPSLHGVSSMAELIRILRELKDLKYLRADDNLEDIALRLGLDPEVLRSYKSMYPNLTADQIIREILSSKGANEIKLKNNLEELLETQSE